MRVSISFAVHDFAPRIPEDLIAKVRETLQDPVRNKTKYGSVSELVTTLLYAWTQTNKPLDKI